MLETVNALIAAGDERGALTECEARLAKFPTHGRLHEARGWLLQRRGDAAGAAEAYAKACALDPSLGGAALRAAQCLAQLRRFREAMDLVKAWRPKLPNDRQLEGLYLYLGTKYEAEDHDSWERTAGAGRRIILGGG